MPRQLERRCGCLDRRGWRAARARRDAGRHAALDFGLGFGECGPQLGETFPADHGCKEQPVRLERAADLDERARQIVDKL